MAIKKYVMTRKLTMKTFVVSMDTPSGRQRLGRLADQCRREGIEWEWMVGVDGKKLDPEALARAAGPWCRSLCSPAMVGCALSHIRCWQRVVDEGLSEALILEDDAVLQEGFLSKLQRGLRDVPEDYHLLVAGCFLCSAPMMPKKDHGVRKLKIFFGSHAYVVSQAGARYLLERSHHRANFHIDAQMAFTPGLKMYALSKNIALQDGEDTSQNVSLGFPGSVNRLLSAMKDSDNNSMAFYVNTSFMRVGTYRHHILITPMLLLFLLLGLLKFPWQYMAPFAAIDMLWFPPSTWTDPVLKLGVYSLGFLARSSWRF